MPDHGLQTPVPRERKSTTSDHAPAAGSKADADDVLARRAKNQKDDVKVSSSSMSFQGVVGRATLGQHLIVTNTASSEVGIHIEVESTDPAVTAFALESRHDIVVAPVNANTDPAELWVRYLAPTVGQHTASLVLRHDLGEERIALTGTTMSLEGHGSAQAVEGPEPVRLLPATPSAANHKDARGRLLDAADAVSSLAHTFTSTVPATDVAVAQFESQILAAGSSLNTRIVQWLADENVNEVTVANQKAKSSGVGEIVQFITMKEMEHGVHLLGLGNPYGALGIMAVDLGWNALRTLIDNSDYDKRTKDFKDRSAGITRFASGATDAATTELATRFAHRVSAYESRRAVLQAKAGGEANRTLLRIQKLLARIEHADLASADETYAAAQSLVAEFEDEQDLWAKAAKSVSAAGIIAPQIADKGFADLVEAYTRFRAGGESKAPEHERELVIVGYFDVDRPMNIQLNGFQFGEYENMSNVMWRMMGQKTLADLEGYDVRIRLRGVRDGDVELHQKSTTERSLKATGEVRAAIDSIGEQKIWSMLDGGTIGARTIWGPR